jgi:very-short-patch-repair endonuclease
MTDPSAESCLESLLRLAMIRRGIGPIVLQAQPHPQHRVDFLVHGRLIVEADGEAFHDSERDRQRDAQLTALGYVILRFDYARIVFDIEGVLDEIEAALAAM